MDQAGESAHKRGDGPGSGNDVVPLSRASEQRVERALDALEHALAELIEDMDVCSMDTREAHRIDLTTLRGLPPPALMKALEALYDGAFASMGFTTNDRSIPITTRAPLLLESMDLVMAWLETVIVLGEHIRIIGLRGPKAGQP